MTKLGERRLPFEGAANFRDLGGYEVGGGHQTRWQRIYRSDSLADLTKVDLNRLASLDLHGLIDFRLPHERQIHPNRLPDGAAIRTVEIGFWPEGVAAVHQAFHTEGVEAASIEAATMNFYRNFPLGHCHEYRVMLEEIEAAAGRPMLLHCVSGKDRTGFGAAVILMALGASRSVILEDYALSNAFRRDVSHLIPPGTPAEIVQAFTAANPIYLDAALSAITQTYGSDAAYLERGLGLSDSRRAHLRDILTEETIPNANRRETPGINNR